MGVFSRISSYPRHSLTVTMDVKLNLLMQRLTFFAILEAVENLTVLLKDSAGYS